MRAAVIPLAAVLLALGLAFATGFDQRTVLPPVLEARFYGFFLDRHPLFAAAIVYGAARLLVATVRPGPASWMRRLLGGGVAIGLFLAACLYPTFGGATLRLAFAGGGTAFITQQPMAAAYALGSGLAALVFASVLGLGALMIGNRARAPRPWLGRLAGVLARYLALWFALAVLGNAQAFGFGPWPRRPLSAADAVLAAALAIAAFLPHLACGGPTARGKRSVARDASA